MMIKGDGADTTKLKIPRHLDAMTQYRTLWHLQLNFATGHGLMDTEDGPEEAAPKSSAASVCHGISGMFQKFDKVL
jgi:hypothetical protein